MKYLFLLVAVILIGLSGATYLSYPDARTSTPVMYWVTDVNPARDMQIAIFHGWLIKTGRHEGVELESHGDAHVAATQISSRINGIIARTVSDNPSLVEGFNQRVERQAKIDEMLEAGDKVPLSWIDNTSYTSTSGRPMTTPRRTRATRPRRWSKRRSRCSPVRPTPVLRLGEGTGTLLASVGLGGTGMMILLCGVAVGILFVMLQRYLVKGIQLGAVKG